jgi:single-strand DNA-binding protein
MNKVILIGNLARDPELRTTQSGVPMCRFTVACNRRVANAQGVREADFIPCVTWRERAEFVSRYFTKGRKIAVEGQIQVRSYEAQDGQKRTMTEVLCDNVEFVDRRDNSDGQGGQGGYASSSGGGYQQGGQGGYASSSAGGYQQGGYTPAQRPAERAPADGFIQVDDDELPF